MEDRLFEQLTFSTTADRRRRRGSVPLSLLVHATALGGVLIVPVLTSSDLPRAALSHEVLASPAMLVPALPPPRGVPARSLETCGPSPAPPTAGSVVLLPTSRPDVPVPEGTGWDTADLAECEGCVPWGVDGGVLGPSPAPLDPAPSPPAVRPGGRIDPPVKLHHVAPAYPDLARDARVEGIVVIECRIDTEGRVADARVLRGHPLLGDAALDAVRQWRYRPTLLHGRPVSVIMSVTVRFTLRR